MHRLNIHRVSKQARKFTVVIFLINKDFKLYFYFLFKQVFNKAI